MNIITTARGLSRTARTITGAALVGGLVVAGLSIAGAANAADQDATGSQPTSTGVTNPTDHYYGEKKLDSISVVQNADGTESISYYSDGVEIASTHGPAGGDATSDTPQQGGGQATPTGDPSKTITVPDGTPHEDGKVVGSNPSETITMPEGTPHEEGGPADQLPTP